MSAAVDGGRRRNAATTARRLLEAARARFAREGFDRTSIRDIAGDAGVDQALVIRYFGSKEKLFAAACPAEPKTYGIFAGPKDEVPERLLDWLTAIEGGSGDSQFVGLLQSGDDDAATRLLRARLERFTAQLAATMEGPTRELRADLITAWLLGIAVMSRIARRPSLENKTAAELAPYLLPTLRILATSRIHGHDRSIEIDHPLHS